MDKPFTTVGHTLQAVAAVMLIVGGIALIIQGA